MQTLRDAKTLPGKCRRERSTINGEVAREPPGPQARHRQAAHHRSRGDAVSPVSQCRQKPAVTTGAPVAIAAFGWAAEAALPAVCREPGCGLGYDGLGTPRVSLCSAC